MSKTFDLSTLNLSAGTHEITVKAMANGYADSPASNSVSYVVVGEETYTVSGTWVFDDDITLKEQFFGIEMVDFTSNGIAYMSIQPETKELFYDDTLVCANYKPHLGWLSQAYRTITFDGTQTVSKEFYEWLTANATKQ